MFFFFILVKKNSGPKKGAENMIPIGKVLELMIMFSTLVLLIVSFNHEKK